MTKKNINIDKELQKIQANLINNERYQELLGGIYSLNQQIAELEHLRIEADTERLSIERSYEFQKRQLTN